VPAQFGAAVVAARAVNGASEANRTVYPLCYRATAADPEIVAENTDARRTSWPLTLDCTTIDLNDLK
jgi:hypothetical protein